MQSKMKENGVTLVEVMIALVVLLIVFMGLIQASIVTIDTNVRNEIRDESVQLASEYMTLSKSSQFESITAWSTVVNRRFRNWPAFPFQVDQQVTDLDLENKQVTVRVSWSYRWNTFNHTIIENVRNKGWNTF